MNKPILLFTNSLEKEIGGMEIHQSAFIEYFEANNNSFYVIVITDKIRIYKHKLLIKEYSLINNFINYLNENFENAIFFFNNLSWIKETPAIKLSVKTKALYILRSGGNDILRAPYDNDDIPLYERQKIIVNIINNYIDILIVNSDFSYERNAQIGINPKVMKKIRGGVNCNLIKNLLSQREKNRIQFKDQYHISNKKILSIVSRFVDFKGIIEFLDYYSKLDYRKYLLLLVGDGKLYKRIYNKMNSNFSKEYYHFTGAVSHNEALRYISISDVLLNPSIEVKRFFKNEYYIHTETMGRTMMEAICLNVPILALKSGGTQEIFEENSNIGICTNYLDNLEELLEKVETIDCFPQKDYSWERVFSEYLKLFE